MIKKPRYAKIAITIPEDDLAAADAVARERDRSRSWVISEAVRRYIADPARAFETAAPSPDIGAHFQQVRRYGKSGARAHHSPGFRINLESGAPGHRTFHN